MQWKVEPAVDIEVFITGAGPFDELFTAPVVDVTSYLRGGGITIKRGRSDEFTAFQSGSCSFTLKNDNREFDPSWPGQVTIDGGALGAVLPDVVDAGGTTSLPGDVFDAAAEANSSPFAEILKPLRAVIVQASYGGVGHQLFVGYIDGWPRGWTKTTGSVDIVAHDAISVMARTETSPSLGVLVLDHPDDGKLDRGRLAGDLPEQFTHQRVRSLLQLGGFGTSPSAFQIDTSLTRVMAVEPTGNILNLVQAAETAEAGFFYVSKSGRITFLDRHSRFRNTRIGDVQAVFTDSQYMALEIDHDLTQVWNDVSFTRPGGSEQRAVDDVSVHDYGYISRRQEIPVVSDGETQARAEFWVDRYGMPQDRPAPIVVNPRKNMAALFAKVASRELLDRIQIERTPLGVGPTVTYTGLVESIEHRITNESWLTTLAMSPIDVSEGDDFMILDDATLGQINVHSLAY